MIGAEKNGQFILFPSTENGQREVEQLHTIGSSLVLGSEIQLVQIDSEAAATDEATMPLFADEQKADAEVIVELDPEARYAIDDGRIVSIAAYRAALARRELIDMSVEPLGSD
jgi:hypothetical protein